MSAQRRTTVREKAPAPAAAASPGKRAVDKPAASDRRTKDRPATERGRAVTEARQSVLAARTQSVQRVFRDSWSEVKKVNWPDQETARNLTLLVIAISIVLGIALGGIDWVLQKLFEAMT